MIILRIKDNYAHKIVQFLAYLVSIQWIQSSNKHLLSTYTVEDDEHLINLSINEYGNSAMVLSEHIIRGIYPNWENLPEVSWMMSRHQMDEKEGKCISRKRKLLNKSHVPEAEQSD